MTSAIRQTDRLAPANITSMNSSRLTTSLLVAFALACTIGGATLIASAIAMAAEPAPITVPTDSEPAPLASHGHG